MLAFLLSIKWDTCGVIIKSKGGGIMSILLIIGLLVVAFLYGFWAPLLGGSVNTRRDFLDDITDFMILDYLFNGKRK